MEENPKSIARPRVCPRPTRYKKVRRGLGMNRVKMPRRRRRVSYRRRRRRRSYQRGEGLLSFSCLSPWPVPRSLDCEEKPIKQRPCPIPFHWQHGPTRTETTTTTTATTRRGDLVHTTQVAPETTLATRRRVALPSHAFHQSGGQGHWDRGVEWRGRLGGQESLDVGHVQETPIAGRRSPYKDPRDHGGDKRTSWCDAYNDNYRFCGACCAKPTSA